MTVVSIKHDREDALDRAAAALAAGGLVAIPTETVYGLAADATNGEAVARIFAAKGRPRFNPLICHVSDMAMAERLVTFDPLSRKLAEAFWPGPLTLVLPLAEGSAVAALVTGGLDTLAVRMPRGIAGALISRYGRPLAAPSANPSGRVSPTRADHVAADLGEKIDLILDAGPSPVGLESTIVRVEDGRVRLLRPGGLAAGDIEAVTGAPLQRSATPTAIEAPGMMASHYAPNARIRLAVTSVQPGEVLINFADQPIEGRASAACEIELSARGDLDEAAANLFDAIKRADALGPIAIAVAAIPDEGLGEAINDRLQRAAAPRD